MFAADVALSWWLVVGGALSMSNLFARCRSSIHIHIDIQHPLERRTAMAITSHCPVRAINVYWQPAFRLFYNFLVDL